MAAPGPEGHAPHSLRVALDKAGPAIVVTLHGDVDARVTTRLRAVLGTLVAAYPRIVLDLGSVEVIDSAGLSVLMRSYRNARQHGGLLCLAAPPAFIHHVLHFKHLDTYFPVFDERAQALAWLTTRRLPSEADDRTERVCGR